MKTTYQTDIFNYVDHKTYLAAVVSEAKKRSVSHGVRYISQKAGLRSPATLSMIINGQRRLTLAVAEKLAMALGLERSRRSYLKCLARLDGSLNGDEKTHLQQTMLQLRSLVPAREIEHEEYQILTSWLSLALHSLVGTQGFKNDIEWMQSRLAFKTTANEITEALKLLKKHGWLIETDGNLCANEVSLKTGEDVLKMAVRTYHVNMLALARQALEFPLDRRELNGLTVAIPKSKLPEVKEKLRAFRHELNESLSACDVTDEVYQLNLQFFPLTKEPVRV